MTVPIAEMLGLLGAIEGLGTTVQFGTWLYNYLAGVGRERKADAIRRFLEGLGNTGEHEVRKLVVDWDAARRPRLREADREALIATLLNLTRRARFVTTQGGTRTSYLRSLPLIEQLISGVQPRRRKGERVAPGQDWRLERYLGMGTFGEVWMARNPGFPEPRAYKFFTHPGALQALRREQESLSAVRTHLHDHPHLIEFLDVAIEGHEVPFLALEYAGGGSLEDWILEDAEDRPALDAHAVIRGLADGLATAHQYGIFHRDLKPANIVLTAGPHPVAKITDFGLGKVAAEAGSRGMASATASQGVAVGTPMYLPPEAQDQPTGREPGQDDVFALGVVWYQLLVNRLKRPPYDYADELRDHGADSRTIGLIARCLARPEGRFKHAGELADAFSDDWLPDWLPPAGYFDVQHLFNEYHAGRMG